jgi:predicted RNase H-like HicB family nuclease
VKKPYTMLIEWSEEDQIYIVTLPEFGEFVKTHGSTYVEAVQNGEEVLEMILEDLERENLPAPQPQHYRLETAA